MDRKFSSLRTVEDLSILTGIAFEEYLEQLFTDLGFDAKRTPATRDFGADLILRDVDKVIVVQAKQHASSIGVESVKEAHFGKSYYNADAGWVIATSSFTSAAQEAGRKLGIRLIGSLELQELIDAAASGDILSKYPLEHYHLAKKASDLEESIYIDEQAIAILVKMRSAELGKPRKKRDRALARALFPYILKRQKRLEDKKTQLQQLQRQLAAKHISPLPRRAKEVTRVETKWVEGELHCKVHCRNK